MTSLGNTADPTVSHRLGWFSRIMQHRAYNEYVWAYIFLAPAIVVFLLFLVYPAIQSVIYSFQDLSVLRVDHPFIGFSNYVTLLTDPIWWTAVINTFVYTAATVPFTIVMALLIALLLTPLHSRAQTVFKTIFYMPGVTSAVVIGLVWLWIFYPFAEGLGNFVVTSVGLPKQNWLGICQHGPLVDRVHGLDDGSGRDDRAVHGGAWEHPAIHVRSSRNRLCDRLESVPQRDMAAHQAHNALRRNHGHGRIIPGL